MAENQMYHKGFFRKKNSEIKMKPEAKKKISKILIYQKKSSLRVYRFHLRQLKPNIVIKAENDYIFSVYKNRII